MQFQAYVATIMDTYLGYWSDGVLAAYLLVDIGGANVAIGGNLLNSADAEANRLYGEEFALRLMRAGGVTIWHDLLGREIDVLFAPAFPHGRAVGVENPPGEPGERFVFAELRPPHISRPHEEALRQLGVETPLRPPTSVAGRLG